MFTAAERRFVEALASASSLPTDYVIDKLLRDGAVREDRLVKLRLVRFAGQELDLSELDALEAIDIDGELDRIELGELPRLQLLDLSDSKVETLDVSGCPALTGLKLARTQLKALPSLPSTLEVLDCASVPLGSFAPRLPKLKTLAIGHCSLSRLDLAGAPALASLHAEFNQLAELDLSAQHGLEVFWGQGNGARLKLPAAAPLQKLSIGKNPLRVFDAGDFPQLETLFVDETGLETLTLNNPKLQHLDCSKNLLTSLDFSNARSVRNLNAESNRFQKLDLEALHRLSNLTLDSTTGVACTELQKHTLPTLRARFGLPKPTKTLSKMDLFQLHAYVQSYNWDDGEKRLFEVIRHPECSLATALLVYWQSQLHDFSGYRKPKDAPRDEQKLVELLREIEAAVEARRFAPGLIAFDATDVNGVDISHADPKIPNCMRAPAPATPLPSSKPKPTKSKPTKSKPTKPKPTKPKPTKPKPTKPKPTKRPR